MFTIGSGNTITVTQTNTQNATIEAEAGDNTITQTAANVLSFNFGLILPATGDTAGGSGTGSNGG